MHSYQVKEANMKNLYTVESKHMSFRKDRTMEISGARG